MKDSNIKPDKIEAVPTNIITGFLGAGKTSAILHLLKNKPSDERWAVLVNEFGEIGVDGSLFEGQHTEQQKVFIREVPGGCMCCTSGLPMQIALNQLLATAKPDRLLIEPTGLGHPKEVLQILSEEYYKDVLSLQKTLTLVDARKLADEHYTSHDTFNQQIAIADTIIGNKQDLYLADEKAKLEAYAKTTGQPYAELHFTQHGEISTNLLAGATQTQFEKAHHHHHEKETTTLVSEQPFPKCGYIKASNQGEGFESVGWRFSPEKVFNHRRLLELLDSISAERLKAVFITNMGVYGYNLTSDGLLEIPLDDCMESRIEIIATHVSGELEPRLVAALDVTTNP